MKRLTRTLLERSQQACLLSLELFNKPTIKYRIEGFCFFYINAWELLCKARIIDESGHDRSVYFPKKRNEPLRTISLRDALVKAIPDESNPVRKNVETIAGLRDHATHFLIPEMEAVYAGLFQAGTLNYAEYLRQWFGKRVSEQGTPPLLSLVWDVQDLAPKVIEKKHGAQARRFMEEELLRLHAKTEETQDRRFSISVEYKLVLTKKPDQADITLGAGPGGALVAQVIHVPKDSALSHPHKGGDVVRLVGKRLPEDVVFSTHSLQAISHKEKVKKADSEWHYLLKQSGTHCYSDIFVDFLVERITNDPGYLERARASYKNYLASRRRQAG